MTTPASGSGRSRPRVLCIDGDPASRRMLASLLERLGCVAVLAESGAQAREVCEPRPRFLLTILEPHVPDEDGLALLRDLRAHLADRAAPAVIFSASPPKTCPAGAMAVLRKPDDLARLAHAVKSALVADARRAQLARTERLEREVKETYANVAHPTEAPPPPDSLPESLLPSGSLAAPAVPTGVGSSGTRRVPLRSDSGAPGARAGGRR